MNSFTEENYLKAIYKLWLIENEAVSTNEIAELVSTKAATVTDMLKKLSDKKLINYKKYQGVTLTEKGKKQAIQILRKHRLWEVFLQKKLLFKWDEVHEMAEQLEHIQSDELIDRLDDFLGNPKFDPHGDPIPDKNGKINSLSAFPLSQLKDLGEYVFTGVDDHSKGFLQYLSHQKLAIGDIIKVTKVIEFDKSLEVVCHKKKLFLSNNAANNIMVIKA